MDLWIVVPSLALIAVVFVVLPVAAGVCSYYRRAKIVACPEACRDAVIEVHAIRAAVGAIFDRRSVAITSCSLWPRRRACAQQCTTGTMRDAPVRAV
jgi:hypothetical protein